MQARKKLAMLVVLTGLLSVVATPANAGTTGQWVSDSTGNPIPVPTQNYTVDHFFDLTTSVGFSGLSFTADVGHLLFNASLTTPAYSPTPVSWSSPLNWDNPIIPLAWYQNSVQHAQNGDVIGISTSGNTEFYPLTSFDTLIHGGPTATEVSVPIPLPLPPGVTFNLGTRVAFNVTINGSRSVLLDQNATLETLIIDNGSSLQSISGKTLLVNGPLINNGQMVLSGPATAHALTNSGQLTIATGGSIGSTSPFANDGSLTLNGGVMCVSAGFSNFGNVQWTAGAILNVNGYSTPATTVNRGTFTISGGDPKIIAASMTLNNQGTITQQGNGTTLYFSGANDGMNSAWGSTLNNQAGAVYDVQGDGLLVTSAMGMGTINNAGLFRKSAGTGTAYVGFGPNPQAAGVVFNNTGTVEVDSGTLRLDNGGSSTGGTFVVADGSRLVLAGGGFNFVGAHLVTGSGTLEIDRGSLVAPTGQTATINFAGGANLLVTSGGLYANPGGSLVLNQSGASTVRLAGGVVGGSGGTINNGRFQWTSGVISNLNSVYNPGSLTNSSSDFTLSGTGTKTIAASTALNNQGTIVQQGDGTTLYFSGANDGMNSAWGSTLNNQAGAVYDVQGDGLLVTSAMGMGTINNAGLFRKSAGTGTAYVGFGPNPQAAGVVFNNTGTVEVDSGILRLDNGGSSTTGSLVVADGARLVLAGGAFNFVGSHLVSGKGTIEIDRGSLVAPAGQTATINFAGGGNLLVTSGGLYANPGGSLVLNQSGASTVQLAGGVVGGSGGTINNGKFQWTSGVISNLNSVYNPGSLTNNSSDFTLSGIGTKTIAASTILNNQGTIAQQGDGTTLLFGGANDGMGSAWGATLNNRAGAVYDIQGDDLLVTSAMGMGTINNAGLFRKSAGTGIAYVGFGPNPQAAGVVFNNTGTVEVDSGTLCFDRSFTQTAGMTNLNGGNLSVGNAVIQGGTLTGSGAIAGSVSNSGDVVSPGHSPGTIIINGSYTQGSSGTLLIELAGLSAGQFDVLDVNGRANLGGTLELSFLNGYYPALGDSFSILDYGSRSGSFSTIEVLGNSDYQFSSAYTADGLTVTTTATPEPASLALLALGGLALLRRRRPSAGVAVTR